VIRESPAQALEIGQQSLHEIEGAVEVWKQRVLPEMEAGLLQKAQTNGYISLRLQEMSSYYSNRMSYQEVEKLIERFSGARLLSDQKIDQLVQSKAQQISQQWREEIERLDPEAEPGLIQVDTELDLYAEQAEEILLFEDGIQVKAQSPKRQSKTKPPSEPTQQTSVSATSIVLSDVALLQTSANQFVYLCSPIDATGQPLLPLEVMVRTQLRQTYGTAKDALPVVVISDGATVIRNRLARLFTPGVRVILDWYHLCEKLRQLMSMISLNRDQKRTHLKLMLSELWHGQVESVLTYLQTQVKVRNPDKLQELLGYLEKHRLEIIDYERRRKAGKSIGSGRMEKGVDLVAVFPGSLWLIWFWAWVRGASCNEA
jgi:hypothetical protein